MSFIWGLLGVLTVLGIAFLLSSNRKAINLRTILGGLAIQFAFAFAVLKWELGKKVLEKMTFAVNDIVGFANEGINFLFGGLFQEGSGVGMVFAFQVLTTVIFFSSLISVLYYTGIMQIIIKVIGGGLSKLLGTSKAESMSAAANIFVGQTEAPLIVRPFLNKMTKSELFAVMTGGLASVAGSVLIGYSLLGVPLEYLLAASFMAAPAGLVLAKIMIPETEVSETTNDITIEKDTESVNVVDAAARGASVGLQLALNIGAMLLAFIALVALINGIIGFAGGLFGFENLTLETILGFVFAPLAFAVGVPWAEAVQAGGYIGQKLVLNEFVAYSAFAPEISSLSPKTVAVVSFALCGFANISSMAILLGGLGNLAPDRRNDIAKLGIRSVIAGALASLLSAAIAGMLI
ncbi:MULTISPECIES: NupC/NupG family nucleoside CNT transporter [Cytobacillus]|jgi:CNT family concentrative nucleoside transporter|uniref:Nucleoside permease n=1 Tax=Cytobacillus pseudoceanisediminis TaxID=3051614 RepID=A0ABZ2ZQD8_9BACI|nr:MULTISPECIES: NupC/NupG family nucleoside CNT transporter [Cytobacillus]EFV76007.1 nucleoside transporter [Bacillus sp. 2_A_57_CT2]MBY0156124.1 NupC/NupG family nucleoside CNT transporter [Cytobacillus firmus]MBU8728721.1 NupC/NupG family nucleoside CNT transporter [Cytobacillus oceanisediminis]MCM3244018.1 NupC/NupG family nucleoside CNT transporter [Cytobacillus oceanisediminis]MCM3395536.1 NupC/NupG family nucleoside CNT transporter [Cytobacillus oceanisediminis]